VAGTCPTLCYFSGAPTQIGGGQRLPLYGGTTRPNLARALIDAFKEANWIPPRTFISHAAALLYSSFFFGIRPLFSRRRETSGSPAKTCADQTHHDKESVNLEFRTEVFICSTEPNSEGQTEMSTTSGFWQNSSQPTCPRIIQFGLKLNSEQNDVVVGRAKPSPLSF